MYRAECRLILFFCRVFYSPTFIKDWGLLTPRAFWLRRVAAGIRVVRSDELLCALRSRPIIGVLWGVGSAVLAPEFGNPLNRSEAL